MLKNHNKYIYNNKYFKYFCEEEDFDFCIFSAVEKALINALRLTLMDALAPDFAKEQVVIIN